MNEVKSIANNTEIPLLFFVKYTGYERKLQPAIAGNPCIYVKLWKYKITKVLEGLKNGGGG